MSDRPYQMLPPLDEDQRHVLRQSIVANGVLEPVVFDEDGEILDGHHRVEIAEELDIDYPRRVVTDLDEAGKRRYAITTNVARRQLVPAVRSALVAQLRTQGMSIRQIAVETGLPKSTIADDLRQLSDAGQLDQPERITGVDGRDRPATRPTPTPGPSDSAITPPVDPGTTEATPASALAGAPAANGESPGSFAAPGAGVDAELEAEMARDSQRRAQIRNLTSVLTYLVPQAITPAQLAESGYAPVLDEFKQDDLDRAAETMTTIAAMKRGM